MLPAVTYSNGNWLYAYHNLLIFEALGLSLHSLLVNPALSVHNLRVSTQKLISQCFCFVQLYCPSWTTNKTRSWFTISEKFVYIKHSRPLCWQYRQLKQWNFAFLFTWKMNAMSQTKFIQQAIAYWLSTTAHSISTASWLFGGQTWNGGHRIQMSGPCTTGPPLATAMMQSQAHC